MQTIPADEILCIIETPPRPCSHHGRQFTIDSAASIDELQLKMAVGGAIKTDEMSRETGFPVPVMAVVDLISKRRLALNSTQYEEFELV